MTIFRALPFALLLVLNLTLHAGTELNQIGIEVKGTSRQFIYSNTQDATFFGETHKRNAGSWEGFTVHGHRFLKDYDLLINGTLLDRSAAQKVLVYPDHLERVYAGGLVEELWPVDSLPVIGIHLRSPRPVAAAIIPYFSDGQKASEFSIRLMSGVALLARTTHLARTADADYPVWIAVGARRAVPETVATAAKNLSSPVRVVGFLSRTHQFAVAVGNSTGQAEALIRTYPDRAEQYAEVRQARMERLLEACDVEASDPRFTMALRWAKLSLDALTMNQTGRGIFAGLPWFNNYWGRDTFIALPGATLVTERFTVARDILESFGQFQQRDSLSSDYGRIPNIVTVTDTAFNTADGTPRFVDVTRDYILRSGDEGFLLRMYPVILRSIEGTLKYHCDSLGFLTHKDAETWMDAVGPSGPWSPRGNRANDVQALWARQLDAGVWCATRLGDYLSARRWQTVLDGLKSNFTRCFINSNHIIADHLRTDGSPDLRVRPNQIFTGKLLDAQTRASMVRSVVRELTYRHGVASLAQTDTGFHPFHEYPPYYPKDAAYHNGTVWTWLQGGLISELCRYELADSAFVLTNNAVHQILDRGAVGTQSELLDALTRPGENEPRLSGTVSQAWNLAEFIRNVYDDYLGIRIERGTRRIYLKPHMPQALGNVRTTFQLDGRPLSFTMKADGDTLDVAIAVPDLERPIMVDLILPNNHGKEFTTLVALSSKSRLQIRVCDTLFTISSDRPGFANPRAEPRKSPAREELGKIEFASQRPLEGISALRGPSYPLLSHRLIKTTNPHARVLVSASDPHNDDTGVGMNGNALAYSYPANPLFVPGSFDISNLGVACDDSLAYFTLKFRSLSDPGWHPEYGFQLTFVAITIDTDGGVGSGEREIPANAAYKISSDRAYEKLILIGGGVELRDQAGRTLAAYVPTEDAIASPFGNTLEHEIRFALPINLLGVPNGHWRFTVLAGAQDDHGGAGIGEFRTVNPQRGEWNGGGRVHAGDSNIFDILTAP
jgi:glycogen debranching enzyme